jgi:hypothetical protein
MSPDLIFEMEPFSPLEFPSSAHYPHSSRTTDDHEPPLLYPFPMMVSASHFNSDRRTHPASQSSAGTSSSLPSITNKAPTKPNHRAQVLPKKSPRPNSASPDPTHAIRAAPIHKIIGFKPVFSTQAPESRTPIKKAPREKRLSPPPRSSSFSSSAWILPGRSDAPSDEPRSLELDSSALDFTQHLFRRMDSQKPLQFQTFQSMMSVSVR